MTADRGDTTTDGRAGLLGGLGLGLWVLGLLLGFVVAVEYDPAAADFRDTAVPVLATVTEVTDVRMLVEADGSTFTVAAEPRDLDLFAVGDPVSILADPAQPEAARLDWDVPVTPRRATDFVAPGVLLFLGALAVSADPAILYPSAVRPTARWDR